MNPAEAKSKLQEIIAKNLQKTADVVSRVMTEVPTDAIVRADTLAFDFDDRAHMTVTGAASAGAQVCSAYTLSDHAFGQVAERAGVPAQYARELASGADWQRELGADVLTRTFRHSKSRHLVRSVNGQARGFLSDKFRRLDNRPILDAFIGEVDRGGAVPYSAMASDTRMAVKAIIPEVREVGRDVVALGFELSNSDYGAGTLSLRTFLLRLVCLNGATLEDAMRQVHLGGKLGDNVEFSQRTYELDTKTTVSAVRDVVRGLLAPATFDSLKARIDAASEKEVNWDTVRSSLSKKLTKDELRRAEEAFKGPDVVNLPPGNTSWRASNAVSWLTHSADSADRRLELERIAGQLAA